MRLLLIFIFVPFIGGAVADTETINWHVGDDVYTTTCQSGDTVILPNVPSNPPYGYQFAGWRVKYDFSKLDSSIHGTNHTSDEKSKTWTVNFSYGDIFGISLCSAVNDGVPDEAVSGQYCWCKVTGIQPSNKNIVYEPGADLVWGFAPGSVNISGASCEFNCANDCSYHIRYTAELRRVVFGGQ